MREIFSKIQDYVDTHDLDQSKLSIVFDLLNEFSDKGGYDSKFCVEIFDKFLGFRPDEDTLFAMILHKVYFDDLIDVSYIESTFGSGVMSLLSSLKKISNLQYSNLNTTSQIEVFRKMFLTIAKDIRVVVLWLSIRLCKMKDTFAHSYEELVSLAKETMDVYVPVAGRLGIYRLKTDLEDLSFEYLDPDAFISIKSQVEEMGDLQKFVIEDMRLKVQDFFKERGVDAVVSGRIKSIYSIYKKLKKKNLNSLGHLYDFFAIRIVVPSKKSGTVDHLYGMLGVIHTEWKPLSKRFKDYIAVPKPNGYKSLHTVVLGLTPRDIAQPVEIQIRDFDMHREAEYGVASHWLYKDNGNSNEELIDSKVDWIKGLESLDDFFAEDSGFLQSSDLDLFKDRIFVLTPNADVKDLPAGSTPIDFAYAIHTDLGNRCVMAKVNSSVVPLSSELKNGDVVEIVTRTNASPKLKWLSQVRSNFAKNRIKYWFNNIDKEDNVKEGKRLLNLKLEELGKPLLDRSYSILKNYDNRNLNVLQRESILEEIGKGFKIASNIVRKVYPSKIRKIVNSEEILSDVDIKSVKNSDDSKSSDHDIVVAGEEGLPVKLASCCSPVLGDAIVAYITRGNSVTIHRSVCHLLDSLDGERIIVASWKTLHSHDCKQYNFSVKIEVKVLSRIGLISDITSVISELGIKIVDIDIKNAGNGIFSDFFVLHFDKENELERLLNILSKIDGVLKICQF